MMGFGGLIIFMTLYTLIAMAAGKIFAGFLMTVHFLIVPLIFQYSGLFQRTLVFLNIAKWPFTNFDEPEASGITGTRNFYITFKSKVDNCEIKIGIWHTLCLSSYKKYILNKSRIVDSNSTVEYFIDELKNSGKPIMLYCHGNSNTRAAGHRVKLYKALRGMDFHVIAFDYRGYSDSTGVNPSELGVVEDTLQVYSYLLDLIRNDNKKLEPPIYAWGHSLGTGISAHTFGQLSKLSEKYLEQRVERNINGLILEAPFNNLKDEVANHVLIFMVKWLPFFYTIFVEPFEHHKDFQFRSDYHLSREKNLPVLILHAKDDLVVPYSLGKKLYKCIFNSRDSNDASVRFISFESRLGLGHKWICDAPDLDQIIGEFIKEAKAH